MVFILSSFSLMFFSLCYYGIFFKNNGLFLVSSAFVFYFNRFCRSSFYLASSVKKILCISGDFSLITLFRVFLIRLFSCTFFYKYDFKLIGRGYKFTIFNRGHLQIKVGSTNWVNFFLPKNVFLQNLRRWHHNFQIFQIRTANFFLLMLSLSMVRRLRIPDIYKGKGLRFRKEKIKLKYRKKFGSF